MASPGTTGTERRKRNPAERSFPTPPTVFHALLPPQAPAGHATPRPRTLEERATAEVRAKAAASGAAVRRRLRLMRRRRLEVTSPKSVLVLGHLSPGRLRCGRLRGYPPSAGPVWRPHPLLLPFAPPHQTLLGPVLSLLCFPSRGRTGPGRAGQPRRGP